MWHVRWGAVLLAGMFSVGALCLSPSVARAAPSVARAVSGAHFVRVKGTRFMVGSKPFYFVGANLNVMHGDRARGLAAQTIKAAAADGLRVGRVWALGEGTADASDWARQHQLFRAGPQGWQEAAFLQLDRVLVAAKTHGLRLIITLSNHWKDYGGIPMYLRWAGRRDKASYGYSDHFFSDKKAKKLFLEHLRKVVGRVNSLTKVAYKDDPTIMAWELQNEMSGTPEAAPARRQWIRAMSAEIRRMDVNHLMVPGTIGYDLQLERAEWVRVCKMKEVAYCDQHSYPEEHLRTRRWGDLQRYVDDRVQLAHHVVGKPMVFGEFGFADRGPARRRARRHTRFLRRIFLDGGNGALVWIYQPSLDWRRRYGVLIDQRRHRRVRAALHARARSIERRAPRLRNPLLGAHAGAKPLERTHVLVRQTLPPHADWRRVGEGLERPPLIVPRPSMSPRFKGCEQLLLPVGAFSQASFEESGVWDGGVLVHAYGRRTGWFEYRFVGPSSTANEVLLRLRLSSEYPGSVAPTEGASTVDLLLDGKKLTTWRVPPDNGVGRWFEVNVPSSVLAGWKRGALHRLRVQVPLGPLGNGVAIYGVEAEDNREPVMDPGSPRLIACKSKRPF